jgi:MHS family citrate/tricarballylate:H+ symporter-like MFS transporter
MAADTTDARLTRRAAAAAAIGNALEFYDFTTFAFFAVQIGDAFFPGKSPFLSLMAALATFGAGFVTRPIGAWILGGYADRVGRTPAMILSFTLMGVAIVALALTPGYASIGVAAPVLAITARLVQGFALGGEVGSATAYMMEIAPPHRRGFAISMQGLSQNVAGLVGSLVGLLLSLLLTTAGLEGYGWRIALLLGAVTVPFGLIIRRGLPETLHAAEPDAATTEGAPVVLRDHLRLVLLSLAIIASGTIGTYIFKYLATYGQATLHLSARTAFAAQSVTSAISMIVGPASGWLSDRIGRKPLILLPYAIFLLAIMPIFLWITHARDATSYILGTGFLALLSAIPFSPLYAAMTESLPKAIRTRTFAMVYAIAVALFGGTTQFVVTWLIHVTGSPLAPAWYLAGATAIGVAATALLRESAPVKRMLATSPFGEIAATAA